jgi:tRNA 2-thiouridine synthesizing protein A
MSPSWLGRPAGRHAAPSRGLARGPASGKVQPQPVTPVSPVTDAARAATAGTPIPATAAPGDAPQVTIDALGRKCPIPIIMLAERVNEVPVGAVIAVLADDPAAYTDIPAWCGLKSHDCVFRSNHASGWSFGVRRRY